MVQAAALVEVRRYHGSATRLRRIDASAPRDHVVASPWGHARLAAAVVDRLTSRAHVIETGSSSHRLRATERARKGGTATA